MEPTPRIRALLNYCSDTALPRSNPAGPLPSTRRATVPRAALLTSAHPDVPRAKAVGTESLSEMRCDWSSVPLRKTRALLSIVGRGWTSPASEGRWGSNSSNLFQFVHSNLLQEFVPICSFEFVPRRPLLRRIPVQVTFQIQRVLFFFTFELFQITPTFQYYCNALGN